MSIEDISRFPHRQVTELDLYNIDWSKIPVEHKALFFNRFSQEFSREVEELRFEVLQLRMDNRILKSFLKKNGFGPMIKDDAGEVNAIYI